MDALAISLGHNSSAILIRDGRVVGGYEQERFSGVKSDSQYPQAAIDELVRRHGVSPDLQVCIGHWFTDGRLPAESNKYLDYEHLRSLNPAEIHSLDPDFTHHDSHAESVEVFGAENMPGFDYHILVADGFGSYGEVLSLYKVNSSGRKLLLRVRGYDLSLGLLYQYATAFMGMKMHNHEYKMLAYEVHVYEVLGHDQIKLLDRLAQEQASRYLETYHKVRLGHDQDPVTSLDALPKLQMSINTMLTNMLMYFGDRIGLNEYEVRVITSYFVQRVVESVILTIVGLYDVKNLMVAGGLFYNVKLNMLVSQRIEGHFCAMPLAGDQGAAIGVYNSVFADLEWPSHAGQGNALAWGHRDLHFDKYAWPEGFVVVDSEDQAEELIRNTLRKGGWINLVRGAMEFGPRALCNTTTLALPKSDIAAQINRANDRTMEMPFAPVMTQDQCNEHFVGGEKVVNSLEYMIMALPYRRGMHENVIGAAHYYQRDDVFTGRPQVTADPMMVSLLNDFGPLVNTSFNFHGVPIVCTEQQIIHSHSMQWMTAPELKPTTVVVRSSNE